jgi:hypothetical protein
MDPLGLVNLGLRLIDTVTWRSRLRLHFDWIQDATERIIFRFSIANNGRRRVTIREIRFGTTDTPKAQGHLTKSLLEAMPLTIDPDASSPSMVYVIDANDAREFQRLMRNGEIKRMFVENTRGKVKTFDLPVKPS